jgi:predicted DNA-binding transcriptional regulator AlpA
MTTTTKRFYDIDDVKRITGLTNSTIYKMAKEGTFPNPIKVTPSQNIWQVKKIDDWVVEIDKAKALKAKAKAKKGG